MADGAFTERNLAILLGACMACLFVLVAWQSQRANDYQRQFYEVRSTYEHILRTCDQRADGSAECSPRAFTPLTSTTVAVQGAK